MIKRTIQEDLTIINIYAPNTRASQYIRQMLTTLKEETHSNKIILGDFNTPLTLIDRSPTQKINQEIQVLKKYIRPDVPNWYLQYILSDNSRICIFLNYTWTFSRIDNILGQKPCLGKIKKTEIVSRTFSDHNMRVDNNHMRGEKNC